MRKPPLSDDDDDDDDDFDRPSPLLQTQRFSKSGTVGAKNLHIIQTKPKSTEVSNLKINLGRIHDNDEDDSLNDTDDDTNTKTGRSSSSVTTSQLTPKPKNRSFLKKDGEKPQIKPRHTGINDDDDDDDDERNVFGKTKVEPSPRHQILSFREEEERNQSFMQTFANEKKQQSPTDLFSADHRFDSRKNQKNFSNDPQNKKQTDSDDENRLSTRKLKRNEFKNSRHSPTSFDQTKLQNHSSRSKESTDQSDSDEEFSMKPSQKQGFRKEQQLYNDSVQDMDLNFVQHQPSSSRPSSANKRGGESGKRSSHFEVSDFVIPSTTTNQKPQSRPTSAKSNTTRQQTQSAIDTVANVNVPPTFDPLTSNNEALAASLQPPSPLPRSSAKLPPKPKPSLHTTAGSSNKKQAFKIPSRYREITSRVDNGRNPAAASDLTRSVERAIQKELQSKTLPRPQSARSRKQSASSNSSAGRRRRSSSAYEHVQPRVNTNRSINFDELNASQFRNDSSQSIKDVAYLEWLKNKEERRKLEKEQVKLWEQEKTKIVDKSRVERQVQLNAQNLDRWRQEKEKEIIKRKNEEIRLKREEEEKKIQEEKKIKNEAKAGFEEWKIKKDEKLTLQITESRNKKSEIEQQQEEKQKKVLEAEKAYEKWMNRKTDQAKKERETKKHTRENQFKKLHENEETKFVGAQEAYEKWLQEKEKYEVDETLNTKRRNSLRNKPQVPFLPGGSQKNTGKIRHAVW
ncbi:unnamed protein product [Rotaria magnacalcarata]|uniref:Microtubule-associated protein 9 n=3 Tax=Rotaria magnacalcarata TaxID=392030 RepID=A0A816YAZ7_9BILA|nr:unnamed protein product [Rotaria magnacalcarata]